MKKPTALLVNPWIYDFAAHDFWLKPLGLLQIAARLRNCGWDIKLIDCLDRNYPGLPGSKNDRWGCGRYCREEIEKPGILKHIPRKYKRYGIPVELFEQSIENLNPDVILVSSGMTYWYPGVFQAIKILKKRFKNKPVILGGIYATLCKEHARALSGAEVIPGSDPQEIAKKINCLPGNDPVPAADFLRDTFPAYDLYDRPGYAALRTSTGCPFRCSYCASALIHRNFGQRQPQDVVSELEYFYKNLNIKNFAFYDDALFFNAESHIIKILNGILEKKIECFFHTPNGLHARFISQGLADLMKKANFISPHISLETTDEQRQKETGAKITNAEFALTIRNLRKAGYRPADIVAYIMMGMPGQPFEETEESIRFVNGLGLKVSLSEYSPIPGTKDWLKYKFNLTDPLLHNNSIFPLHPVQDLPKFQKLKDLAHSMNEKLR